VSTCFAGLKPLQRHRLVNEVLSPLFATELHAVAMETLTPDEFLK
jgi:stress-induced morphogen